MHIRSPVVGGARCLWHTEQEFLSESERVDVLSAWLFKNFTMCETLVKMNISLGRGEEWTSDNSYSQICGL